MKPVRKDCHSTVRPAVLLAPLLLAKQNEGLRNNEAAGLPE